MLNKLLGGWWLLRARYRRAQGRYDRETLRYFFRAWQCSKHPDDLLACVLFRRDLGDQLSERWARCLLSGVDELRPMRRLLVCSLVLEARGSCPDDVRLEAGDYSANRHGIQQPAVLYCLEKSSNQYLPTQQQYQLLAIYQQQLQWRNLFKKQLQDWVSNRGMGIIGNAGFMNGSALGETIDQADGVVRFNAFAGPATKTTDLGQRLSVWVMTPGFKQSDLSGFADQCRWIIITGPEIQHRMLDWSGISVWRDRGWPVITIPLAVWKSMVAELAAPPSAGILLLAFLHHLLGSWQGVNVAGFGGLLDIDDQPYHLSDKKHQASERHNWSGEQKILQRWLADGLCSLHAQRG